MNAPQAVLRWQNPPPLPPRGGRRSLILPTVLDELRRNPGKWGLIRYYSSSGAWYAAKRANTLYRGFEFCARRDTIDRTRTALYGRATR